MLRTLSVVLACACVSHLAPAQSHSHLTLIDLSESGEVFRFEMPRKSEQPITAHLLPSAEWDELEFEVRGAVVGEAQTFRVPRVATQLTPAVTEGDFAWRPADFLVTNQDLFFVVVPHRERFTVRLERPTAGPDAPYYSYSRFVDYFAEIQTEPLAQVTQLGTSLQGRPLYRVIVDPPSNKPKKTVLMAVRQHGNEDGGSWLLEGALDLLLSRNGQVPEPELLERIRWIIYPLMNPDGAVANQRGNANGTDLNRDWNRNGCSVTGQEPETFAFQCDVEALHAMWPIAVVGDHHGWGNSNHGGFRYAQGLSVSFVTVPEYQEARKDTKVIERWDPTQFLWTENGGTAGMLRSEIFLRFGFLLHTPEYNSSISNQQEFYQKGQAWLRAMHDTLYAPRFTDVEGKARLRATLGSPLFVTVDDEDENTSPEAKNTVEVTLTDLVTGDTETLTLLETGANTGVFRNTTALMVRAGQPSAGNGALESTLNSKIEATYIDDDYPRDASSATIIVLDALPGTGTPTSGDLHRASGQVSPVRRQG